MEEHSIILDGMKLLTVTGVQDINEFDESSISISLDGRTLQVTGDNLHVQKLDPETGEMVVDGLVSSLRYLGKATNKQNLFSRLFR